jgi:CubicO group peptidase (beta-lactamase class C family)
MLKVSVPAELIHGDVDEGYGPVADAFRRNFVERGEIGASVAVFRDGAKVVDLWGGYRDGVERTPWERDTLVNVFSTTKGIASMALAVAHSRGLLDYDAPVAAYWPEFAAHGKQHVTVRQLLSHQAGLAAIDRPLDLDTLADLDLLADALAEQAPAWQPGVRHGYHGVTLGWYEGELLRRVDPDRRSLGRFFADEIAGPLGIDCHIGVPDDLDASRFATVHGFKPAEMLLHMHELPPRFVLAFLNPRSLTGRAFGNPKLLGETDNYNRPDVRRLEIPAANGHSNARSVAAAYGALATGGEQLGLTSQTLAALTEPARPPTAGRRDTVLHVDTTYSLGYMKPFPRFRFGTSAGRAFGTPGAGGSFGFADPDTGIGFAYVMNRSGFRLWDDPREVALRQALYRDVLGEASQHPD